MDGPRCPHARSHVCCCWLGMDSVCSHASCCHQTRRCCAKRSAATNELNWKRQHTQQHTADIVTQYTSYLVDATSLLTAHLLAPHLLLVPSTATAFHSLLPLPSSYTRFVSLTSSLLFSKSDLSHVSALSFLRSFLPVPCSLGHSPLFPPPLSVCPAVQSCLLPPSVPL